MERVINKAEAEYEKFVTVAKLLTEKSPNGAKYVVRDVYLDFGQGWMWTTICREGYMECQVLYPREWKKIVLSDSFTELEQIANEIRNGKYFGDK